MATWTEEYRACQRETIMLKRQALMRLLKNLPGASDRVLAAMGSVDHKTVARIRKKMIEVGDLSKCEKVIGMDGKSRSIKKDKRLPS